jgi:hypothetical protein
VFVIGYEEQLVPIGFCAGRWTLMQYYLSISSDRTFTGIMICVVSVY